MPASKPRAGDGQRVWRDAGLAAVAALSFALAFAPANLWPLIILVPGALALCALSSTPRRMLAGVFISQVVLWWWLDRWLIDVTVAGYLAKGFYNAAFPTLFVWLVRRVAANRSQWPMALVVPVLWVGLETLRGEVIFAGYPWYLVGHPLIEAPLLAQSADLFGAWFVSFVVACLSGALVDVVRGPRRFGLVVASVVVVFNVGYGAWRWFAPPQGRPGPRILVVQTNVPSSNKVAWTDEEKDRDMAAFIALTREGLAAAGDVDAIVWPETMLPGQGLEPDMLERLRQFGEPYGRRARHAERLVRFQREVGVPILVGSMAWVDTQLVEVTFDDGAAGVRLEPTFIYNSVYLVDGEPPYARYDKSHLTPFGEVMPYIAKWPWLEARLLGVGAPGIQLGLHANPVVAHLVVPSEDGGNTLATPICFEDTMGRVCRRMVYDAGSKHADMIMNLSNDGWFGERGSGRVHHAQIARYRAIENRVPVVRAANTGCSVVIDSLGRVVARVGEGVYGTPRTAGWFVTDVALDDRVTWYGRVGDTWAWACLALTALTLLPTRWWAPGASPDESRKQG